VFLGTLLTLVADKVGRRRVLLAGSLLMISSGLVFALFENFWILLFAAITGVLSVTGGDFGPFRSIEESIISQLTTPSTRADVLAWYVTSSTLGSSIGSEASGRIIHYLQNRAGWNDIDAYHTLFWIYAVMGCVNVVFVLLLTDACELRGDNKGAEQYTQVPQHDHGQSTTPSGADRSHQTAVEDDVEAVSSPPTPITPRIPQLPATDKSKGWLSRMRFTFTSALTQITPQTRSIMYKLWAFLMVDSLADGMVPYSLTTYYMDERFHPSKSTLGDITSISFLLSSLGAVFAGPLARRIGLINTMVFTHVPSSTAVLLFPFSPMFWLTALLLFVRTGLNNMDQAPRSAFIAAVVREDERTAVMGITSLVRNLAAMAGPTVTGLLAEGDRFGVAFIVAGVCRLVYDFGLYWLFVGHERGRKLQDRGNDDDEDDVEDEDVELESLARSESEEQELKLSNVNGKSNSNGELHVPIEEMQRVRSRSPHRSGATD
jgi:MFS family permease